MSVSTVFIKCHVGLLQLLKCACHTSFFTHVEPSCWTVDLQQFNLHAATTFLFIPSGKIGTQKTQRKCYFDLWNDYRSVPLHEDDQQLATFIILWGRYRYCVASPPRLHCWWWLHTEIWWNNIPQKSNIPQKNKMRGWFCCGLVRYQIFQQVIHWITICGKNGIYCITLNLTNFVHVVFTKDVVNPCTS